MLFGALIATGLFGSSASGAEPSPVVEVIEVTGIIDPANADFLHGRLQGAQDTADAAVIRLDTPGGLEVSMRDMVRDVLESQIPVVVWVAPRAARAASAGTFIAYAAHLSFMASATEIGAATPVNLAGDGAGAAARKAANDAAAFLRELAELRGRDAEWADEAVFSGASLGATEAAERGVVDGLASSLEDLLRAMDGKVVELADGTTVTLETWAEDVGAPSATVRFAQMNLGQRLLHFITDPEIAYFLLLFGIFGLIFEIYNPGIGLAGILGAVAVLLSLYAFNVLPTNWAGALLTLLAIALFIVDLQTAGLGIWTAGGLVALVAGALTLFAGASSAVELSGWAVAGAVAVTVLFFISVMTAALRVRLRRPVTGQDGIIGTVGEAKTDIAPEGTVLTNGALWRARTMETGIAAGAPVRVKATEGLVLLVEPLHDQEENPIPS